MFIKTLPAGRYFIGNPSTVMDCDDFNEFVDLYSQDELALNGIIANYIQNSTFSQIIVNTDSSVFECSISDYAGAHLAIIEESYWEHDISFFDGFIFVTDEPINASFIFKPFTMKLCNKSLSILIKS